jgi:hypothetical protein
MVVGLDGASATAMIEPLTPIPVLAGAQLRPPSVDVATVAAPPPMYTVDGVLGLITTVLMLPSTDA